VRPRMRTVFQLAPLLRLGLRRRAMCAVSSLNSSESDASVPLTAIQGADVKAFRDSLRLYRRCRAMPPGEFSTKLQRSLDVLVDAYRLYGPRGVTSSFNGGKDAVACLHLQRAALAGYCTDFRPEKSPVQVWRVEAIFFIIDDEFPEVRDFVETVADAHDLALDRLQCGWIEGLRSRIPETNPESGLVASRAFVLGTRAGDPNAAGQQHFGPSSSWMPPFMRVNPIIDWSYAEVWEFLRGFDLPYCSLYDKGYTSLGKRADTMPNPALRRDDGTYAPAYMLDCSELERAGRHNAAVHAPNKAKDGKAMNNGVRAEDPKILKVRKNAVKQQCQDTQLLGTFTNGQG